ncbi:MAG: hypothetical protein BJ554DRAFT_4222, partial [Olpidium bornovanus]
MRWSLRESQARLAVRSASFPSLNTATVSSKSCCCRLSLLFGTACLVDHIALPAVHSKLRPEYPRYFEDKALAMLEANGYPRYGPIPNNRGPVVIQNFEISPLENGQGHFAAHVPKPQACNAEWLRRSRRVRDLRRFHEGGEKRTAPKRCLEIPHVFRGQCRWQILLRVFQFYTIGADEVFRYLRIPYDHDEVQRLGGFISAKDLSQEVKKRRFAQT